MDAFTADYLANLTAELSALVIPKVAQRFQAKWQGDETSQALERCLHAGVLGMVSKASLDAPEYEVHLAAIFTEFFQNQAVAGELLRLVRVQPLDVAELAYLFAEAGYEADTLPGVAFPASVAAFEAAFLEAADFEPALRPIIQVNQGWAQTALQREMVTLMRQMVQALGQLSDRQTGIQAGSIVATHVVSGTQIIYEWPGERPLADSARTAYLTWLMTERQNLSLRAVSAGKTGGQEQPPELAQVYVALNTTSRLQEDAGKSSRDSEEQKLLSALKAVADHKQLVLLGDPGSGKSTFVSHLAFCMAAHGLYPAENWQAQLPEWPEENADLLPMLLVLRDFARWLPEPLPRKAHARHLWDFLAETMEKEKLEGVLPLVESALADGRVLLLLDGLDEVTTLEQRRFVRDAVQAFAQRFSGNHLLITCRIFSYQPPDEEKGEEDLRLPLEAFPSFELAPFSGEQQDTFVAAWYRELKRQGHLPGLDENRLSQDLQRAIRGSDLQRVAGNPLLLTVMAMVHVEEGRLPDSRALLYNKTVDLLLSRWEKTKDEDAVPRLRQLLQEAGRTDVDLKTRLAEVAFTIHTQGGSAGKPGEQVADIADGYLCQELSRLHKRDLGWGQALLGVIKTRAGLLIERSPGQFAFPHRTFQEYLAGAHLAGQPEFPDKAFRWAQSSIGWWPMVLFAVEHLVYVNERPLDPLPLVSRLFPPEMVESSDSWLSMWFAGQVLLSLGVARAEDSEWGKQLLARVSQGLANLVGGGHLSVRERAEAGKVLAQLGDPRPGVGIILRDGMKLPDILWSEEVPSGIYPYQDTKVAVKQPYRLSRYPITNAQFDCFFNAPDRDDEAWWRDMALNEGERLVEPAFPYANHPRETVSWYQAVAFCRWLDDKLQRGLLKSDQLAGELEQYKIDLPSETEWEVAARYPDGREYPWDNDFDQEKVNTWEGGIRQTTAVGMYPSGRNRALELYDMSGNVWEWCRNKYKNRADEDVDASGAARVLRGVSWVSHQNFARAAYRFDLFPDNRRNDYGFRVVLVGRSPSHHDH